MTKNDKKVGNLIGKLRNELGISQQELANILGKSKPAICQWESGMGIKSEELYNIAKFFDITVDELVEGKLKHESNELVWRRNYNLESFDFEYDINENNSEKFKKYYECCKNVHNRFFSMLQDWSNDKLSNDELEEFRYLRQYFDLDIDYYNYINVELNKTIIVQEQDEKEFITKIFEKYQLNSKELEWEISKAYVFKRDLKEEIVFNSKSPKALEWLLSIIPQVKKDILLLNHLQKKVTKEQESFSCGKPSTIITNEDYLLDEIEKTWFFKVMLNGGCNVMLSRKPDCQIKEKLLEKITVVKETKINENPGLYRYFSGRPDYNSNDWKLYSLKDYENIVDHDKTDFYKDVVNLKDSNPYEYYRNYVKRNEVK